MSIVNAQLVTLLRESEKPLPRASLVASCAPLGASSNDVDDHMRSLVEGARVFPWSKDRFWNEPELAYYSDQAREWIADRPLWKSLLVKRLEALGMDSPKSIYERVFTNLKQAPDVHSWPAHGGLRGESLCLRPVDLDFYLGELKKHFEAARQKLGNAGIGEASLLEFLAGHPLAGGTAPEQASSPAVPATESDADFQRDVAEHLIFCWSDATSLETREALEVAMYNVGLTRFGERDAAVAFNGIEHQCGEPIFPGDPATITEPGWMLQRGPRKRILAKATVSPNT